jgi:serpin B
MKKIMVWLSVVTLLIPVLACSQPLTTGELIQSDKPRVTSPEVDETDLALLVEGNSVFAFNLYQALKAGNENFFYSPYSISLALAMTYAGARGETEQQMADTIHFTLPQDRLHPAFNSIDTELGKRGQGAEGEDDEGFRLHVANAIWGQKDYQFLPTFLDVLAENYGAGLRPADFAREPEQSRITINEWVSEQTEGKIKDLVPQGLIHSLTRLVLTNAIYFNAAWSYPFKESMTKEEPFYLLDGSEVTVLMMEQTENFVGYTEGEGYQAVELPYKGHELSMVILLPREENFEQFEGALSYQLVDSILEALEHDHINLKMPRFSFKSEFSLSETLAAMGMPDAFSAGAADFSGMTGNRELSIQEVVHKAFVSVDEAGTEAAAATAVTMPTSAPPEEPIVVNINRPFIFLIRDIETGSLLFMGRVLNPVQ